MTHFMKISAIALLGVALWMGPEGPGPVLADSCWSGPVSHVSFGAVGPKGGTAVGSVSATCQKAWSASPQPTYFRICMEIPGGSPINTINPRAMSNYSGGRVEYDLYSDPSHSRIIGDRVGVYTATATISQAGNPRQIISMPVYGKIRPGQSARAGSYQSQNYVNLYWVSSTTSMPAATACSGGRAISAIHQATTAAWEDSCSILAANDLAFGVRDSLATSAQAQTTVSISCPVGTAWQVGLSNGQNFSGARRMYNNDRAGWVDYHLFQNHGRTQPWGNEPGINTRGGTGIGSTQQLTIFGSVPAQPGAAPGSYEDTVVVTLTY